MLHITWVLLVVVTSLVLVGFRLEVPQRVHSALPPQINTAPSNRVNRQNWEEIIQRNGVFCPKKSCLWARLCKFISFWANFSTLRQHRDSSAVFATLYSPTHSPLNVFPKKKWFFPKRSSWPKPLFTWMGLHQDYICTSPYQICQRREIKFSTSRWRRCKEKTASFNFFTGLALHKTIDGTAPDITHT